MIKLEEDCIEGLLAGPLRQPLLHGYGRHIPDILSFYFGLKSNEDPYNLRKRGDFFKIYLCYFFSKIYTVFIILCFSFASTKLAKDALRKIPAKQSRHSQLLTDYLRARNWNALFYVKPCILLFTFKSFHKEAK